MSLPGVNERRASIFGIGAKGVAVGEDGRTLQPAVRNAGWSEWALAVNANQFWRQIIDFSWIFRRQSRIQMYTHMKTNVATRPIYAVQEKLKAKKLKNSSGNKTNKQHRQ